MYRIWQQPFFAAYVYVIRIFLSLCKGQVARKFFWAYGPQLIFLSFSETVEYMTFYFKSLHPLSTSSLLFLFSLLTPSWSFVIQHLADSSKSRVLIWKEDLVTKQRIPIVHMTPVWFFPFPSSLPSYDCFFTLDCQAMRRTPTDKLSISSSQCFRKPCCLPLSPPINLSTWHRFCSCYQMHGDYCCKVEIRRTQSGNLGIHGVVLSTPYLALGNNKNDNNTIEIEIDLLTTII